jgi:hypothetical protein
MVDQQEIIHRLENWYGLNRKQWQIEPDGTVNISHGRVRLQMPVSYLGVQFGIVNAGFDCGDLNTLVSLEGAPREVHGPFRCQGNLFKTLQHAPREVHGDFFCSGNRLEDLEGAPEIVLGDFFCSKNQLRTLVGAPHKVQSFWCRENPLENLNGLPEIMQQCVLSYHENLPLLRTLVADTIELDGASTELQELMNDKRWVGQGKKRAMMCAAELIRSGYGVNAKW